MDRIIGTIIETENAIRIMSAIGQAIDHVVDGLPIQPGGGNDANGFAAIFAAVALRDPQLVKQQYAHVIEHIQQRPLLYVPLAKGGNAQQIVAVRARQDAIKDLLRSLSRLGLLEETYGLCQTALAMERNHRVGAGAVTEFDELFKIAFMSMVDSIVLSATKLRRTAATPAGGQRKSEDVRPENVLFECLEMITESMLIMWLEHDQTLRLTVLEKVADEASWKRLVEFIQNYGENLFTQKLLQLGNIRAILHQGVESWLGELIKSPEGEGLAIVRGLQQNLPLAKAVRYVTLILEAVLENYNEYRDYNSTTTQSDRGELLYMLLDFLRIRVRYDRVSWRLRPMVWAHRVLVNQAENKVARMWRRSLAERVGDEADRYLIRFRQLRKKYAMQMMTVHDRLAEKFVHPMQIDRLRSLVRQSVHKPGSAAARRAFDRLERETDQLAGRPTGVGVDLPHWLAALEEEVELLPLPECLRTDAARHCLIPATPLPLAILRERLERLPTRDQ